MHADAAGGGSRDSAPGGVAVDAAGRIVVAGPSLVIVGEMAGPSGDLDKAVARLR